MVDIIMRLVFVLFPAILVGLLFSLMDIYIGVMVAVGMMGLGWQITSPKRNRGEGNYWD